MTWSSSAKLNNRIKSSCNPRVKVFLDCSSYLFSHAYWCTDVSGYFSAVTLDKSVKEEHNHREHESEWINESEWILNIHCSSCHHCQERRRNENQLEAPQKNYNMKFVEAAGRVKMKIYVLFYGWNLEVHFIIITSSRWFYPEALKLYCPIHMNLKALWSSEVCWKSRGWGYIYISYLLAFKAESYTKHLLLGWVVRCKIGSLKWNMNKMPKL